MEKCRKTIHEYCYKSIKHIGKTRAKEVEELYSKFPYEKFAKGLILKTVNQFGVRQNSYEYDDCFDAGMMAYIYCIHRFAVIDCIYKRAYMYKVISIYIKCAIIVSSESRNICKENHFKLIELDNLDNRNRF